MSSWIVYCLSTVQEPINTYIGATIDKDRRLDQHNRGRKAGGAKLTSMRPNEWYRVCHVRGFLDKHSALSFEWHWKFYSRKENGNALQKRQKGLDKCIEWCENKNLEILYQ